MRNITFRLTTVCVMWANLYTEHIPFEYACLQFKYVGAGRFETVVELVTAHAWIKLCIESDSMFFYSVIVFCRQRTTRQRCTVRPSMGTLLWSVSCWSTRVTRPLETAERRQPWTWQLSTAGESRCSGKIFRTKSWLMFLGKVVTIGNTRSQLFIIQPTKAQL